MRRFAGLAVGTAWALACADGPQRPESTVRDSNGIRIVTHVGPTAPNRLTLSSTPVLEIGSEHDSTTTLDRVVGVVRLTNGQLVIANRTEPLLRWYGSNGKLERAAGRIGGGPGEFNSELGVGGLWHMAGDSIAAWDQVNGRIQGFDATGAFGRSFTLQHAPGARDGRFGLQILGFNGDKLVAAVSRNGLSPVNRDVWRDSLQYQEWNAEGEYGSSRLGVLGPETYTHAFVQRAWSRFAQTDGPPPPPPPPPPFAIPVLSAVSSDRVYYHSGERFEIQAYEKSTAPSLIIRRIARRQAVTSDMKQAYGRELLERAPRPAIRLDLQRWLDAAVYPDSLPAYRRLKVADDGAVWAQRYEAPGAERVSWSIYEPDGSWRGDLELPASLHVLAVGAQYLIALVRDSLDAERVQVFALRSSAPKTR